MLAKIFLVRSPFPVQTRETNLEDCYEEKVCGMLV